MTADVATPTPSPAWSGRDGSETKEGGSHYATGHYLFNEEDGGDGYCVKRDKFEAMYEPVS